MGEIATTILITILLVLLGPLFGMVFGWVVGVFFSSPILRVFEQFGVEGVAMWELGATLGFVAAFLKPRIIKG